MKKEELVRLQKEVFLLEHGFYDDKVIKELVDDWNAREEMYKIYGQGLPLGSLRRHWFRIHFPEFFEGKT
jgi:hypothetical protein